MPIFFHESPFFFWLKALVQLGHLHLPYISYANEFIHFHVPHLLQNMNQTYRSWFFFTLNVRSTKSIIFDISITRKALKTFIFVSRGGRGPKSLRGPIAEKASHHFKKASILLKMYLKSLAILEKA
jgi:hypothetical protein